MKTKKTDLTNAQATLNTLYNIGKRNSLVVHLWLSGVAIHEKWDVISQPEDGRRRRSGGGTQQVDSMVFDHFNHVHKFSVDDRCWNWTHPTTWHSLITTSVADTHSCCFYRPEC